MERHTASICALYCCRNVSKGKCSRSAGVSSSSCCSDMLHIGGLRNFRQCLIVRERIVRGGEGESCNKNVNHSNHTTKTTTLGPRRWPHRSFWPSASTLRLGKIPADAFVLVPGDAREDLRRLAGCCRFGCGVSLATFFIKTASCRPAAASPILFSARPGLSAAAASWRCCAICIRPSFG